MRCTEELSIEIPPVSSSMMSRSPIEELYRAENVRLQRAIAASFGVEIASEAVSEAFAQLLGRGAEVRDPARWVWKSSFAIARGLAVSGDRQFEQVDLSTLDDEYPSDLIAGLRQLSPLQRQAMVLHYYAGFPLAEIAEVTGSTRAAIKVHLLRGRRRMALLLEET